MAAAPLANDPEYGAVLGAEFDSITAENVMKWAQIRPDEGTPYDFAPADALVDFARANDQRIRGHTLLWANPIRIPGWVNAQTDADTLRGILADHIDTVVGRYKGDIDAWDVVNEPLENTGSTFFENVFRQLLGPDYIAETFRLAHAADPDAKLFLNEVLIETPGNARFDAFYDLLSGLVADGVPIHGVGFQGHLVRNIVDPDPADFRAAIQAFTDLGLAVEITELDVVLAGGGADPLGDQRDIVFEFMSACLSFAACDGVTFWGFTDRYTWIDGTFGPGLQPLPFDVDYLPKPAYEGARDALLNRLAATVPEPSLGVLLLVVAAALRRTR